jgi:hypothetical protein
MSRAFWATVAVAIFLAVPAFVWAPPEIIIMLVAYEALGLGVVGTYDIRHGDGGSGPLRPA